jgi:hypothetical protein
MAGGQRCTLKEKAMGPERQLIIWTLPGGVIKAATAAPGRVT